MEQRVEDVAQRGQDQSCAEQREQWGHLALSVCPYEPMEGSKLHVLKDTGVSRPVLTHA
jgi:hypothetical protein